MRGSHTRTRTRTRTHTELYAAQLQGVLSLIEERSKWQSLRVQGRAIGRGGAIGGHRAVLEAADYLYERGASPLRSVEYLSKFYVTNLSN